MPDFICTECKAPLGGFELAFLENEGICMACWETGLLGLAESYEAQTELRPNFDKAGRVIPRSN